MIYPIANRTIFAILRGFIKKVEGLENIPNNSAVIIAANHESYLDPLLIVASIIPKIDTKIHFLAKKGRFWKIFGDYISRNWAGCIPLDEGKEKALQTMIDLVRQGEMGAFFPGGPRTLDGQMTRGKTGAVRVALAAKVPILPVGLIGTFELAPRERLIPKFKRAVTIKIGEPIYFNKYYKARVTTRLLRNLTDKIMRKISNLINKPYNPLDFDIKKLLIILPCYDTQNHLGPLLKKLKKYNKDILVIDDGSKDKTAEIAKKAHVNIIKHEVNLGKGAALKTGFKYAIDQGYEAVIIVDGDGQHDPKEIPNFIRNARGMDIIVGDRIHNIEPMPLSRRWANRISSFIVSRICGQTISDTQCGYRLIKTKVLKDLDLVLNGYQLDTELLIKAARKRYSIGEMPIKTIYADETSHIKSIKIFCQFIKAIFLR